VRIVLNGQVRELVNAMTVAQLLELLEVEPRRVAVEINRELVPRARHSSYSIAENDAVEIVTLVGGG
jgi:thiamine biosynthesis protein ThiS